MSKIKTRKHITKNTLQVWVDISKGKMQYKSWMTIQQLADIPECKVSADTLRSRIQRGSFGTVLEAITTPHLERNQYSTAKKKDRPVSKVDAILDPFWSIGSMWKESLIMQSRRVG